MIGFGLFVIFVLIYIPIHLIRSHLKKHREREFQKTAKTHTYSHCVFVNGQWFDSQLKGTNATIIFDPRFFEMKVVYFTNQSRRSTWNEEVDGLQYLSVSESGGNARLDVTDKDGSPFSIIIPNMTADSIWSALDDVSPLPRQRFSFPLGSGGEAPTEELGPVLVEDGAGWSPSAGFSGRLRIFSDHFAIGTLGASTDVPLSSLVDVQVNEQSLTTGGGFFGGGFGAKSAVEGMVISSILNDLSTKTEKWVTVKIVTDAGWVQIRLAHFDDVLVRNTLRVLSDRACKNKEDLTKAATPEPQSGDFVSELERLKQLHDSGALSEIEFVAAKAKVVNEAPEEPESPNTMP